jgi:iron complex transport system ATP-binding protein
MIRLETQGLTLRAGERTLCEGLSVGLRASENWAVLGANGSGKTTLLHVLAGLQPPQAGEVLLDGTPIAGVATRERARRLALLFQDHEGGLAGNVLETVLTGRHPHLGALEWESAADREIARTALAAVGLTGFESRTLATLSGGERRRVDIAAVLTQDAPLGLYDEPTLHLDLRHQIGILAELAARAARPGHLNAFVLHDPYLALRFASHALLLFGDGSHCHGPLVEVLTQPNLERLYGVPLRAVQVGAQTLFLPA